MIGKLFKDLAVPDFVGLGQIAASNAPAKAKMIRLAAMRIQGYHQIPKAIPIGQLPENHAQKLVPASEMPYEFIAFILVDHPVENSLRQELYDLCENIFPLVHRWPFWWPT